MRDQLAAARAELDELHDLARRGEASVRFVARAEPQIQARIDQLETDERHMTTPSALHTLLAPGGDVAERWHQAPVATRREVARLLLAPDMLGEVRIMRSHRKAKGSRLVPPIERVQWYRDDPAKTVDPRPPQYQRTPPRDEQQASLEQSIRNQHAAGHSQRTIAGNLNIGRGTIRGVLRAAAEETPR